MKRNAVWIVFTNEERQGDWILGVFGSSAEASDFAEVESGKFDNGLLIGNYAIGWTYMEGATRHRG